MPGSTRRRLWIGIGCVAALCLGVGVLRVWPDSSEGPPELPSTAPSPERLRRALEASKPRTDLRHRHDNKNRPLLTVDRLDRPARYKIGEPIRLAGRLVVPEGYTLFQKQIFLEHRSGTGKTASTIYSRAFPLRAMDDRVWTFDIELNVDAREALGTRPGPYAVHLRASDLEPLVDDELTEIRSSRIPDLYPEAVYSYQLTK